MKKQLTTLGLILTMLITLFTPTLAFAEKNADEKSNELKYGFKLVHEEELEDVASTAYIYEHEKSGAELIWLKNDDPFKVFSANFKTKPNADDGAPHIVEHAVLGGSRKYKSDDIFNDLYTRSTNAFMNAMTYPDKTVFPVASRDPQDFFNLTDVYLDSVYYPMILENRQFFDREGWRYEIFNKEDDIKYNGVVYNEMLGSMSDPMRHFLFATLEAVFPDTFYVNNSGGTPEAIPTLSYEEFVEFYKTYYSPSNTLLYLYGDVEIDKFLEHIDKEYLSHFEKSDTVVTYEKQEPFNEHREIIKYYNLEDDAPDEGQAYMSLNYFAGDGDEIDYFTQAITSYALFDATEAPVREALRKAGIGQDSGSISLSFNQNSFGVAAIKANLEQKDDFVKIVEETIAKVAEEGFDKDQLLATINFMEMQYRKADSSGLRGMDYLMQILDSYNYGRDPFAYLRFTPIFTELREMVDNGSFEKYLKEKVVENKSSALSVLAPQKGLAEEFKAKTAADLAAYKESLSDEELDELIERSVTLRDVPIFSEEDYNLPKLNIEDIDTSLSEINFEAKELDKYTLLSNVMSTGGINYVSMQFDLSVIEPSELPYVSLLASLLGQLDTENLTRGEFEKEIFMYTGSGISVNTSNSQNFAGDAFDSRVEVAAHATTEYIDEMFNLIKEMLFNTVYEDKEWIANRINNLRSSMEMGVVSNASSVILQRTRSYHDPIFAYRELLSGIDYLQFIQEVDDNFEEMSDDLIKKLQEVGTKVFNSQNLVVGVSTDESELKAVEASLTEFVNALPDEEQENGKFEVEVVKRNEAIQVNTDANYVAKSANLSKYMDESEIDGSINVLTLILDNEYLHPEIRLKGGAYGAFSFVDNYNNFVALSYSDPNIAETVEVYNKLGNFLKDFEMSDEDLEQLIIGYFKSSPISGEAAASDIVFRHINGYDNEFFEKHAQEVLDTKLEDIKKYSEALTKGMEEHNICVIANKAKIEENIDLFDNVIQITKSDAPELTDPVAADPEDPILGRWVLDTLEFEGQEIPASAALEVKLEVEFREDGTAVYFVDGELDTESPEGLWLNQDGNYILSEDGIVSEFNIGEDGTFSMTDPQGIIMYFAPVTDQESEDDTEEAAEVEETTEETEEPKEEVEETAEETEEDAEKVEEAKKTEDSEEPKEEVEKAESQPDKESKEDNSDTDAKPETKTNDYETIVEVRDEHVDDVVFQIVTQEGDKLSFTEVEIEDFNAWIDEEALVLIDFYAPWCGPCLKCLPEIDQFAELYGEDLRIIKINVDFLADETMADLQKVTIERFDVNAIPALFILKDGQQIGAWTGCNEEILAEIHATIENELGK